MLGVLIARGEDSLRAAMLHSAPGERCWKVAPILGTAVRTGPHRKARSCGESVCMAANIETYIMQARRSSLCRSRASRRPLARLAKIRNGSVRHVGKPTDDKKGEIVLAHSVPLWEMQQRKW